MTIAIEDRETSAATIAHVEQHVRALEVQRVTGIQPEQRLALGQHVRRWQPAQHEVRSVASAIKNHAHKIAAALIGTPSAVALAHAMQATAVDAGGIDDPATVPAASATGGLLASIPDWAVNIIASMATNNDEPLDVADRVSNDVAVKADSCSILDDATANGNQVTFVPDANACNACQDAAGTYAPDDAPSLPVHSNCSCSLEVQ